MLRLLPLLLFLLVMGCDSSDTMEEPPPPAVPPYTVTYSLEITGPPEQMSIRYRDADGTVVTQSQNLAGLEEIVLTIEVDDVDVVDNTYFIEASGLLEPGKKADVSMLVVQEDVEIGFMEDQEFATEISPDVFARAAVSLPRN